MSLSEDIQDAITRHQVYMLRYSAGREAEAAEYIDRITSKIVNELQNNDDLSTMELQKLQSVLADIVEFADENYIQLAEKMIDDASRLIEAEIDWNGSIFSSLLSQDIISPDNLTTEIAVFAAGIAIDKGMMSLRNAVDGFRNNKRRQLLQQIQDGLAMYESNQQMEERIRMQNPLQKRQAATLIRTISNHVSNKTRDAVLRNNIGLFDGYKWVAILDSRTSLICASRDGKVYPLTDDPVKSPKPPAHFSCRSTITPQVKAGFEDRVEKQPRRTAEGAKGKKFVQFKTNYESWLKRQPASFQDDVLGPSRGKLFRNGGLSLSKFIDMSGKTLTLDELRKLEPDVFNRVKL